MCDLSLWFIWDVWQLDLFTVSTLTSVSWNKTTHNWSTSPHSGVYLIQWSFIVWKMLKLYGESYSWLQLHPEHVRKNGKLSGFCDTFMWVMWMPELTACLSSISAALINNVLLQLHERKEVLQWAETHRTKSLSQIQPGSLCHSRKAS